MIIEKGFEIELNGKPIKPLDLRILSPKQALDESSMDATQEIRPYVFRERSTESKSISSWGSTGNSPRRWKIEEDLNAEANARPEEGGSRLDGHLQRSRGAHGDKSAVTGTEGVPSFHNQFISISGVVSFKSNEATKLPLTTTKRGIDVSSNVFLLVRDRMREGLRIFTAFTYRWKGKIDDSRDHFRNLVPRNRRRS